VGVIGKVQESFARKLFAGLLGTVAVLLLVTYGVVRSVTARQLQAEAERVSRNAASRMTESGFVPPPRPFWRWRWPPQPARSGRERPVPRSSPR
jgi:hypothetical protein